MTVEPTAPVTGDLRDQIAEALNSSLTTPEGNIKPATDLPWDRHDKHRFLYNCTVCQGDVKAIADVVVARLESLLPLGDLPRQLADAIKSVRIRPELGPITMAMIQAGSGFHLTDDEARKVVDAILPVERRTAVVLAAENARLRASEEAAVAEHQVTRERLDEARRRECTAVCRDVERERDELAGQVAALQRDLAEARAAAGQFAAERDQELARFNQYREWTAEVVAERDAVVAAVRTAQVTHIRTAHPDRMHHPDCGGCWVFLTLSRDLPSRPDDPEEIRRLAESEPE